MAKEDLATLAKKEFDDLNKREGELKAELADISTKLNPLKAFLVASGVIPKAEVKKRGRKPKEVIPVK